MSPPIPPTPQLPTACPLLSILYSIKDHPAIGFFHFRSKSPESIGKLLCEMSNSGLTLISQLLVFDIVNVSYDQIHGSYTGSGSNPTSA